MIKAATDQATKPQPRPQAYQHWATPTCGICGCTADEPCFDGEHICFWVTLDRETNTGLCSECLGF